MFSPLYVMYKKPSSSCWSSYTVDIRAAACGGGADRQGRGDSGLPSTRNKDNDQALWCFAYLPPEPCSMTIPAAVQTATEQRAPVGGSTCRTKMKIAFSGDSLMRLRMTYTNWPTVKSAGTRYLHNTAAGHVTIGFQHLYILYLPGNGCLIECSGAPSMSLSPVC